MRVIVCGGRNFWDEAVFDNLDYIHRTHGPITELAHGGATGADAMAARWAFKRGVKAQKYPADWAKHGRKAGPMRNRKMFFDFKPDAVIAFPGGRGTADMVNVAVNHGGKVIDLRSER